MQKPGVFHQISKHVQTRHGARFPLSLAFELLMSLRKDVNVYFTQGSLYSGNLMYP